MFALFHRSICRIILITVLNTVSSMKEVTETADWRVVETVAEEYPYVVALLNRSKEYVCTGTIVGEQAVLTSGFCIDPRPAYVAVGVAAISENSTPSALLHVGHTKLHGDYTFVMKATEPDATRIHSNIGLVFVVRPILTTFLPAAPIGQYFASELHDVGLTSIGYGARRGRKLTLLQYQDYDQAPCANPRWYYCICGIEITSPNTTYEIDIGVGAPVLYRGEVVGIAVAPSRTLRLKPNGAKYNIFTVIGPYIPWIQRTKHNVTLSMRVSSETQNIRYEALLIIVLFLFKIFIIT